YARCLQLLSQYSPLESIECLMTLPQKHVRSALTAQCMGKAYIDSNDYTAAVMAYRQMRSFEPHRVQGSEYYSTALWHLKREKELASLGHSVYSTDKYSAECYVVMGNLFSLLRDTEVALKYFNRAITLAPCMSYAYTLAGYEYMHTDQLDSAIHHFHLALLYNSRHYNALYGLGSVAYRQERYEVAEAYFHRAREINTRSSVLDCYYGKL
ncbi:tetratricopeptide repeat protein, partial [archaeon]